MLLNPSSLHCSLIHILIMFCTFIYFYRWAFRGARGDRELQLPTSSRYWPPVWTLGWSHPSRALWLQAEQRSAVLHFLRWRGNHAVPLAVHGENKRGAGLGSPCQDREHNSSELNNSAAEAEEDTERERQRVVFLHSGFEICRKFFFVFTQHWWKKIEKCVHTLQNSWGWEQSS